MGAKTLVIIRGIWYDRVMESNNDEISQYERQNAVISYCFLWIFILLSRQERFQSNFVNSHARVASVIQFFFLCLIAMAIYSRDLTSMLIFDFSLSNIVYFIGFWILLASLVAGMITALRGKMPRIHLRSLSLTELGNHITPKTVDSIEKIPMVLSHLPLIGNYIAAKYGSSFTSGEKFGTWSVIISILFIWISPSMTLLIIFWSLISLWLIYQSISLAIDENIILLWDYLPDANHVHIFLATLMTYTRWLIVHDHDILPSWREIQILTTKQYHTSTDKTIPERFTLPLINIYALLKNYKNTVLQPEIIQGYLITILFLVGILLQDKSIIFLAIFIGYIGFLSIRFGKYLYIPFLGELAVFLQKCFIWAEEKSKKQTTQFPS